MQAFQNRFCALWLVLVSLVAGCEWTPSAGPVQPERLASGQFVVRAMIDSARSRFAWATRVDDEQTRNFIFDLKSRTSCELPEATFPLSDPLLPPGKVKGTVFLWPLLRRGPDLEESVIFIDERCKRIEFFTVAGSSVSPFVLNGSQGTVLLVNDPKGKLSFVDPWREKEHVIAKGVVGFSELRNGTNEPEAGPQALWLIENGELRLRNLDGTLRVTLGEKVTGFVQGAFSQLRIAFIADGNLYEAVGPKFQPVLLRRDACNPYYSGTLLNYFTPCADRQLERIDLTTGEQEKFAAGVHRESETRGFSFEWQHEKQPDETELLSVFVTPPEGERTQIIPYLDNLQVLDAQNIAGRDATNRFGVWNVETGFREILKGVPEGGIDAFVDSRTSSLLWLVLHDVKDGVGNLSLLEQSGFRFVPLANGVPASGYSVAGLLQVPEPVLIVLRDSRPSVFDEMGRPVRFRGTLDVRLISGELPAEIDTKVSSYATVYDPEAGGLLYAIDSGENQGLWFAAL